MTAFITNWWSSGGADAPVWIDSGNVSHGLTPGMHLTPRWIDRVYWWIDILPFPIPISCFCLLIHILSFLLPVASPPGSRWIIGIDPGNQRIYVRVYPPMTLYVDSFRRMPVPRQTRWMAGMRRRARKRWEPTSREMLSQLCAQASRWACSLLPAVVHVLRHRTAYCV